MQSRWKYVAKGNMVLVVEFLPLLTWAREDHLLVEERERALSLETRLGKEQSSWWHVKQETETQSRDVTANEGVM